MTTAMHRCTLLYVPAGCPDRAHSATPEAGRSVTVLDTEFGNNAGPLIDTARPASVVRIEFDDAPVRAAVLVHSVREIGSGAQRLVRFDGLITEIFSNYDDHRGFPLAEPCALIADAAVCTSGQRATRPAALHAD